MRAPFDEFGPLVPLRSPPLMPVLVPPGREYVSGASHRLRALSALSGSLTDALTPADAANLVERKALSALGATSAVVVTLGRFPVEHASAEPADTPSAPATLHVVHAIGLADELQAALEAQPLDAPLPFAEVAREGKPLFLTSESELLRYPTWGASMMRAGTRSAAIVPVWANGELRGVLGLAWPAAQTFDEDEQAFVLTLGVMCAQAIMRAHLRAGELAARERAEEANRSKARFVRTISHELRTPMTAVLGYADLIAEEIDGPVTPMQRQHLGRVRASGKHLLSLIEDLLAYARVEAGEDIVRAEPVLLDAAIDESIALVRPMMDRKGLLVHVGMASEPIEVYTDPGKLRQVLVNLLANALKFTDKGAVIVRQRLVGADGHAQVCIAVRDTGPGIAVEDRERIFEPFWQGATHGEHNDGGTGLGLAVARQLARLLGGDLVLSSSTLGVGSAFEVSLPVRAAPPTPGQG